MKLFLAKKLRVALAVMAFAGCTAAFAADGQAAFLLPRRLRPRPSSRLRLVTTLQDERKKLSPLIHCEMRRGSFFSMAVFWPPL